MRPGVLYVCYDAVTEPLVQTQVVPYLKGLAAAGFRLHVLTFEKRRLSALEKASYGAAFAESGIRWHVLRYHRRPSLLATVFDVTLGTLTAVGLCLRHRLMVVHARSHVPATMALAAKSVVGTWFLFDVRGLLPDEYAEIGHWQRQGLKYRLVKSIESSLLLPHADALVFLTERIKAELAREERRPVAVIPCCVDTARSVCDAAVRDAVRAQYGWTERKVMIYAGKLGGWYPVGLMVQLFLAAREQDSSLFLQVLTPSDGSELEHALTGCGIARGDYDIRAATPTEVARTLQGADLGLSLILTVPSKRASSPTKLAEYLAAGIPVLSTRGIGDCDELLGTERVGVLLEGNDDVSYRAAAEAALRLLRDPDLRDRCRRVAHRWFSLQTVGMPRYLAIYDKVLALH